jgi:hypothetical protein
MKQLAERRKIRAAKRRIAETLDARGVLKGLSPAHAAKLVEHVWFADRHHEFRGQLGPYDIRVERFFKRGSGQLRRLRSRLDQLRAAFVRVQEQAASIRGDDATPSGNFYLAAALRDVRLPERLKEIAGLLKELRVPSTEIFKIVGKEIHFVEPKSERSRRMFTLRPWQSRP